MDMFCNTDQLLSEKLKCVHGTLGWGVGWHRIKLVWPGHQIMLVWSNDILDIWILSGVI